MDKTHRCTTDKSGIRLDKFISEKCPEFSRTYAKKLIADSYVTVNDQIAKASLKLDVGDRVNITSPPATLNQLLPENIPLNIIYEDEDLLVIDKPAGLATHPAPGHLSHTLVNAVLACLPSLPDSGSTLRPGIVHRLDKDTSGLILVAKNSLALNKLQNQFKTRSVLKVYLVLAKGHLSPESGFIDAPIGRDPGNRKRMSVVDNGKEARTQYRVVKYVGSCSLLEVKPETGRTHQIRVHLGAIGYPVVGDKTYGVKSPHLSQQFLHAYRIGFKLPSTNEYKEFTSELPPNLEQALKDIT
ncbi:MAG: RluA family pseudouridine synthase [Dehalococcoidales bacterium]|jgi:23S rRNA pseudouridine1911/1915/1917 synthase|nr:RluA family pseudouridine synthase [Dehalococcoidales bacterium]